MLSEGGKMVIDVRKGKIKCEEMDDVLKMLIRVCNLEKLVTVVMNIMRQFDGREIKHFMLEYKVLGEVARRVLDEDREESVEWLLGRGSISLGNIALFQFTHSKVTKDFEVAVTLTKNSIDPLAVAALERLFNHLEKCIKE